MNLFVMTLSHSRYSAMVWSRYQDQLSWLRCHNEAFLRLGGIAATNRIDNVKTAIAVGAGSWGRIQLSVLSGGLHTLQAEYPRFLTSARVNGI